MPFLSHLVYNYLTKALFSRPNSVFCKQITIQNKMKRITVLLVLVMSTVFAMAQNSRIDLRSESKAECVKSDMTSLRASFSFSTIEAEDYQSDRGLFSWISMPNTVIGGNEGEQIGRAHV